MKSYHKIIFVVLVYRNSSDLEDFIQSVKKKKIDCKILVINSYYDYESNDRIRSLSMQYNCDFISVENKGYGAGNNRGIEYALENFNFDFLIISNPDVEIISLDQSMLNKYSGGIIGPVIRNFTSKNKNPYWYLNVFLFEWLMYIGAKKNMKELFYIGILLNKCIRILFHLLSKIVKKDSFKVFALQGAFLIFHKTSLLEIEKVFDEEMFLFSEEAHLAFLAKKHKVEMIFDPEIEIFHKQGGSSADILKKEWDFQRRSIVTYYEKWHKNDEK